MAPEALEWHPRASDEGKSMPRIDDASGRCRTESEARGYTPDQDEQGRDERTARSGQSQPKQDPVYCLLRSKAGNCAAFFEDCTGSGMLHGRPQPIKGPSFAPRQMPGANGSRKQQGWSKPVLARMKRMIVSSHGCMDDM